MNEKILETELKELLESNRDQKYQLKRALSIKYKCSVRTIERWVKKFEAGGIKNIFKSKAPKNHHAPVSKETKDQIVALYLFNLAEYINEISEIFKQNSIRVSYSTIRREFNKLTDLGINSFDEFGGLPPEQGAYIKSKYQIEIIELAPPFYGIYKDSIEKNLLSKKKKNLSINQLIPTVPPRYKII